MMSETGAVRRKTNPRTNDTSSSPAANAFEFHLEHLHESARDSPESSIRRYSLAGSTSDDDRESVPSVHSGMRAEA